MSALANAVEARPRRRAGSGAGTHIVVLALCLGALAMAAVLEPARPDKPVTLAGAVLPPMCMMRLTTGVDCPGCGLTRSWVSAAHGDWRGSLGYHRLGWLIMLYVALQAVRHGGWLALASARKAFDRWGAWLDRGLIPLAALLALNWLWGLIAAG